MSAGEAMVVATDEGGAEDRGHMLRESQTREVRPNFTQCQYRALSLEATSNCNPIPKVWEVAFLNLNFMDTQTTKIQEMIQILSFRLQYLHLNGV